MLAAVVALLGALLFDCVLRRLRYLGVESVSTVRKHAYRHSCDRSRSFDQAFALPSCLQLPQSDLAVFSERLRRVQSEEE